MSEIVVDTLCHRLRRSRLLTWRRILPSLKKVSNEVAELNTDLGAQSAHMQKMDAMRSDEQKTSATTKEDFRQVTADVSVVKQRQVPVIQRVQRTVDASTSRVLTLQVESKVGGDDVDVGPGDQGGTFGYSRGETDDVTPLTHSRSTRLERN